LNILALDTSAAVATVALSCGHKLLVEETQNTGLTHSQTLMPMVDRVLQRAKMPLAEVDVFAVAVGPGSFTGLRIGVTAIKGLAAVHQKPVAAIPTLEAMAYNFLYSTRLVCPVLDARNRLIYGAAYDTKKGTAREEIKIASYYIDDFLTQLKDKNIDVLFLGDGAYLHEEIIRKVLGDRAAFAPVGLLEQRASLLCAAAMEYIRADRLLSYGSVIPNYYKKSQPEREETLL
jgi:tRNA threonylcarbamoyladenosine biosynthesis protein TsaB